MMAGEYLLDKYRGSPVCRPERRLLAYCPRAVDANQVLDGPVAGKDCLDCSPRMLARGSSEDRSQRDRILDGFLVPESPWCMREWPLAGIDFAEKLVEADGKQWGDIARRV